MGRNSENRPAKAVENSLSSPERQGNGTVRSIGGLRRWSHLGLASQDRGIPESLITIGALSETQRPVDPVNLWNRKDEK